MYATQLETRFNDGTMFDRQQRSPDLRGADADAQTYSHAEADPHAEAHSHAKTHAQANSHAEADAHAEAHAHSQTDAHAQADPYAYACPGLCDRALGDGLMVARRR